MVPLGEVVGDPQRQKSDAEFAIKVWHWELAPEVVELQLYEEEEEGRKGSVSTTTKAKADGSAHVVTGLRTTTRAVGEEWTRRRGSINSAASKGASRSRASTNDDGTVRAKTRDENVRVGVDLVRLLSVLHSPEER